MHYCCYLYTREFPTDDVIAAALKPFNSEEYYSSEGEEVECPVFTWDYWLVGGRYGGKLLLDCSSEKYEAGFLSRTKRAGRLFRSALLERAAYGIMDCSLEDCQNKIHEAYAMNYCGAYEGELRVDGAWIPDMTNFDEISDWCFCAVDADGTAYAREIWNGEKYIDAEDFDTTLKKIAENNRRDCFLTVIDLHD